VPPDTFIEDNEPDVVTVVLEEPTVLQVVQEVTVLQEQSVGIQGPTGAQGPPGPEGPNPIVDGGRLYNRSTDPRLDLTVDVRPGDVWLAPS
jgi:hypothetical protein